MVGEQIFALDTIQGHLAREESLFISVKNVSLTGPNSIQGRSITVAQASNASFILACATLVATGKDTRYAMAAISNDKISGRIEFIQQGFGHTVVTGQVSV